MSCSSPTRRCRASCDGRPAVLVGTVIADRPTNGLGTPSGGTGLLVATAANGDVYLCDTANNRVLCWVRSTKAVITVAGGNGVGPAANQLFWPGSIALDANRNLFVLDVGNARVRNRSLAPPPAPPWPVETVQGGPPIKSPAR